MKTAISIPDKIFRNAERYARQTKRSRSELYSKAIAEYLDRHAPDEITQRMNQIIDAIGEKADPATHGVTRKTLERAEW